MRNQPTASLPRLSFVKSKLCKAYLSSKPYFQSKTSTTSSEEINFLYAKKYANLYFYQKLTFF